MSDFAQVVPLDDLVAHEGGEDCACGPDLRPELRDDGSCGWIIVHHSLDGREQFE